MGVTGIFLPLAALALGQPAAAQADPPPTQDDEGEQNVEIRIGWDPRPLPFGLNLDSRARPPRSLTEMVDRIYRALPQDRIDMFAAYHGDRDFERVRARFDSTVDFFRDLYTHEILIEAFRIWRFSDRHFWFDRARRCVGDNFVAQVAIQFGMRRYREVGDGPEPSPVRARIGGYLMADLASRRLFALCDRLYSPGRVNFEMGRPTAR
ncbi:MAG TPA: hypothetical protein VEC11_11930 [Allosphingosinicella sp.]|nr:hypothetical protein [Allosphingosinicella sp.]